MLHLNDDQITDILIDKEAQVIKQMEDVFVDYHANVAEMIPKTYLTNRSGDFRAMPARWGDYSGVKWISVYPNNYKHNLPTIHGTLLLNDTYTGEPIVSMDCAKLTGYRTAAVSALAAKHLTPNNIVHTITFIGCGYQAMLHMKMYNAIFPNINHVKLYDINEDNATKLMHWIRDEFGINEVTTYCDTARSATLCTDLITTLTPSTEPFLGDSDIKHPFHINAIGADAVGKRELRNSIWMNSALIVDDYEQASHSGEMQYNTELPYLTLGDIITKTCVKPSGRTTVFDSTGLAIEDIAIGRFIYEEYCKGN
tara:strand:+ start:50 stop:982 length:933 start_codon:yes stop_codon:yes gene_type:complete